jgi:hypothetical protein
MNRDRDWAEFSEYGGDDVDRVNGVLHGMSEDEAADLYPGLFRRGFGALGDDTGEVRLQKVLAFVNSFPRPAKGKAVRADALRQALQGLMPLAQKVAGLADGSKKRGLLARVFGPGGAGYLTSPTVTPEDKATANRVIYEVNTRLADMGAQPVNPVVYEQIKVAAHQLMKIGTDIGEDTSPVVDSFVRYWESAYEAIVDLPDTLIDVAHRAGDEVTQAVWSQIPSWVKWGAAGASVLSVVLIFLAVRAATPYARGYIKQKTGVEGICECPSPRRRRRRNRYPRRRGPA